jgi:uncharacterized membrane protein
LLRNLENQYRILTKKITPEIIFLVLICFVFFTIFTTVALHRYWQFSVWYYDFGIFYSAISAVAQGKAPLIDHYVFPNQNILGDHFHPIIFLISPFMALFKGGETLLVFQTLFVTLSGIFVYLTAKELLKSKLESFAMLIIYFSFLGLHNALITEFHEIVLITLPLMMFFYGMVKKHYWWYLLGLLGVLLTKETTFFIPAWFGLIIAWKNKGLWRKIGLLTLIGSIAYGLAVIKLIIPTINGTGYYYLSNTLGGFSGSFKIETLTAKTILKTIFSFGFLPLLSPETMMPVLYNWFLRILRSGSFDLGMHYNSEIAPTLILSTIYGWQRFKKIFKKHSEYLSKGLFVFAFISLFFNVQILKSPALLFTNKAFYENTKNHQFLNDLIEHIPEDGIVMAQTNIAAHIAYRKVYMLRDDYFKYMPDYIVIDGREGQEPNHFWNIKDYKQLIKTLDADKNYEMFYQSGDQRIYKLK